MSDTINRGESRMSAWRGSRNLMAVLLVAAVIAVAVWVKANRSSGTGEVEATTKGDPAVVGVEIPRLVDLGSTKCKACRELAPILESLREEYEGRLEVQFIDVGQNPAEGEKFTYRLIPTQILFDRGGKEVWRHEGFISEADLKKVFTEKTGIE